MAASRVTDCARLSPLEQKIVLEALEEYTNALAIYHQSLRKPSECTTNVRIDCILPDVNGSETPSIKLSHDAAAGMQDMKEQAARTKLYTDSLYMRKILEDLKNEIRESGTFEGLRREVEAVAIREREEEVIVEEGEKLRNVTADLERRIIDEKIAQEREKTQLLRELSEKQRNAERLKLLADVETRYITAWEKARHEQNSLRCNLEIEELEKRLNDFRLQEENERRIHTELTTFLKQQIASDGEKIKEWQERYRREKAAYEKEIRKIRNEIEARRMELQELKNEYYSNQEFIDTYLAEKEALRKQKEHEEHMRGSAIRIQAWWRGVMVRRKLGPYRPEEKKRKRPLKTKK